MLLSVEPATYGRSVAGISMTIPTHQPAATTTAAPPTSSCQIRRPSRGGPAIRWQPDPPPPDFQFPQMENPQLAEPGWYPKLEDYIYVSFTNAIAFSPTDAMPLTRRAKRLMLAESAISVMTVVLVAGRAVNILR